MNMVLLKTGILTGTKLLVGSLLPLLNNTINSLNCSHKHFFSLVVLVVLVLTYVDISITVIKSFVFA